LLRGPLRTDEERYHGGIVSFLLMIEEFGLVLQDQAEEPAGDTPWWFN
jgi:hypothetical protein